MAGRVSFRGRDLLDMTGEYPSIAMTRDADPLQFSSRL
jgi:hypothetical protein